MEEGGRVPKPFGWFCCALGIPRVCESGLCEEVAYLHEKAREGGAEQEWRAVSWQIGVESRIAENPMEDPPHVGDKCAHL
jgi:hypothetical protein